MSDLFASQGHPFYEKALKKQEYDNHRQDDQTRSRHQQIKLDPVRRLKKR
jgi:hypothetical protein